MNEYHNQAIHNKDFLDNIEAKFPSKYYDWKITVTFYIAIHLLKALGKKRSVNIGSTHHEIFCNFDKSKTANCITTIPDDVWLSYKRLYGYSKSSRYDGISDLSITELAQMADYAEVKKLRQTFCAYMDTQHLKLLA